MPQVTLDLPALLLLWCCRARQWQNDFVAVGELQNHADIPELMAAGVKGSDAAAGKTAGTSTYGCPFAAQRPELVGLAMLKKRFNHKGSLSGESCASVLQVNERSQANFIECA